MKYKKYFLSLMLVCMFFITSIININALESSEVESGIYEVQNDVYHEQEIGMAMSRTYLDPTMKIEKRKENIYFTLKFTGTEYMTNYRIVEDGELIDTEIIEENEDEKSITLKFESDKLQPEIKANIYVEAMERDVVFDVITKIETLKLIEKIEEPEEEPKKELSENNTDTKVNSSNEEKVQNSNSNIILVGIAVIVALGFCIILFTKSKK